MTSICFGSDPIVRVDRNCRSSFDYSSLKPSSTEVKDDKKAASDCPSVSPQALLAATLNGLALLPCLLLDPGYP